LKPASVWCHILGVYLTLLLGVAGEFVLMPRLVFGTDHDNVAANDKI
jgi:hypothetical protein